MERFLQLAARDNIQVVNPSTAAQYFHLLRRQATRSWRKPLVVFTPKSMLRTPISSSPLSALSEGRFPTRHSRSRRRLGKARPDLQRKNRPRKSTAARKNRHDNSVALISLEQLYPFPQEELAAEMERHAGATDFVWVQEEPANMGAFSYVQPQLERLAGGRPVLSVKRSASASPATGSHKAHEMEQHTLIALALGDAAGNLGGGSGHHKRRTARRREVLGSPIHRYRVSIVRKKCVETRNPANRNELYPR